jgi:uncharacterized protein (TIGR02246 family)
MRRLLFLFIGCLLITLPPPLSAQSSGKGPSITFPAPTPQNAAEREIRSAEEQMHAAYVRADKKLFRSLYADDSTFTYWTGQTVGPDERVSDLRAYPDLRDTVQRIRIYGDVAIVTLRSEYADPPRPGNAHRQFTRVWVKRGGMWRVVLFQSTAIQDLSTTR